MTREKNGGTKKRGTEKIKKEGEKKKRGGGKKIKNEARNHLPHGAE
jgi:hypothetical protein